MLTKGQKRAIHMAAAEAGIDARADEDQYRLVLWNVGGFRSAADRTASREGFIAVMAFFEARAGGLGSSQPGYWADENAKANPRDPIVYKIHQAAAALGMDASALDDFLASRHMSSGTYSRLDEAPVRWLVKLLEGLKAITRNRYRKERVR